MTNKENPVLDYIEWEGCVRRDADGDDVFPRVLVYFSTGAWVPYVSATWEQPAEGGFFEDLRFAGAGIEPASLPADPLTEAEIAACREWFDTDRAHEAAQAEALAERGAW